MSVGWGVVGTGEVSRHVVADIRLLDPACRLAISSRSLDRAQQFADDFHLDRAYGSTAELLLDDEVNIVYIATPHATHSTIAIQALEAGKSVLVEKPMGIDVADVRRVADAARAHSRFAMEGMWMKFHPYYIALLEDVRSGGIGELGSVRASFGLPFGEADSTRWSAERASSTLLDQGIYPVTLAYDLFGLPLEIHATSRVRDDGVDLSDAATLQFAGGHFAQIAASMVEYIDPSATVNGSLGWLSMPAPFWATNRYTRHVGGIGEALMSPRAVEFVREGMGYVPMLRAVEQALARGWLEHPVHTLDATIDVARILDEIRATASQSTEITR